MYLEFNKKKQIVSSDEIAFENYSLRYSLTDKEFFFENDAFILFLKTNYSEEYVKKAFLSSNEVTFEDIKKAFQKDGFWVAINKVTNQISVNRDVSGLCTGYCFIEGDSIHIATNVHDIAKKKAKKLNKEAVYQLLYFDFLWDGQTIYGGIDQLRIGGQLILDSDFKVTSDTFSEPLITEQENNLSEKENIEELRKEIVKAHKPYINDLNTVFLSGGIDSVAMLIAIDDLTEKSRIENHSFKVKGTIQDETVYAKSIADHLGIKLTIVERDISNEINESTFREEILKMNNPYPGMWIFGNQIDDSEKKTYFAGQDTRLHTPSLNKLDAIAFKIFSLSKYFKPIFILLDLLLYPFKEVFNFILKKKTITSKYFLGLRRALYLFNTKTYVKLVYFKVDKAIMASYKLPLKHFNTTIKNYNISLKGVKNKRSLYNTIVSKKWIEQYVNDMRYMIDMVDSQGGRLAMPFYDMDLAKFSASIPFKLSVKDMKGKSQFSEKTSTIHKYVLRESLIDKIDEKTYLRSKAVSRTGHIIFNQSLDKILRQVIEKDVLASNSFIKEYNLGAFIERFLKNKKDWIMTDDKYLLKVYYIATIIVYQQNIIK